MVLSALKTTGKIVNSCVEIYVITMQIYLAVGVVV